jgi:hypothetical protein
MRVLNRHTAPVAGLRQGELGELDAENPSVREALKAGLLVAAEARDEALAEGPSAELLGRALLELQGELAHVREVEGQLRAENAQLREQLDAREHELSLARGKSARR